MLVHCSKVWKVLSRADMLRVVLLELVATTPEACAENNRDHSRSHRFDASVLCYMPSSSLYFCLSLSLSLSLSLCVCVCTAASA